MIRALNSIKSGVHALAMFLAISLLICHGEEKKMKMHNDAKAMKQEIAKHIPIGSNIKDAQRIMEANGFECELAERDGFTEMDDDKYEVEHNNIDFLYCDKEKGGLICTRRWQVAIVHKNGIVSDIFVSISRTCL